MKGRWGRGRRKGWDSDSGETLVTGGRGGVGVHVPMKKSLFGTVKFFDELCAEYVPFSEGPLTIHHIISW